MLKLEFPVVFLALYCLFTIHNNKVSGDFLSEDVRPIHLSLYYESLCPDSIMFITKHLWPTFHTIPDIVEIELIPFGFARETLLSDSTYSYDCQHGPNECYANLIQTCAINLLNDTSKSLPFIYCMESASSPYEYGQKCASDLKLDYQSILNCGQSKNGNLWQHEMAIKTKALNPPLKSLPWIVIDGDSSMQTKAFQNLLKLVCSLYKGEKPKSCPSA